MRKYYENVAAEYQETITRESLTTVYADNFVTNNPSFLPGYAEDLQPYQNDGTVQLEYPDNLIAMTPNNGVQQDEPEDLTMHSQSQNLSSYLMDPPQTEPDVTENESRTLPKGVNSTENDENKEPNSNANTLPLDLDNSELKCRGNSDELRLSKELPSCLESPVSNKRLILTLENVSSTSDNISASDASVTDCSTNNSIISAANPRRRRKRCIIKFVE